MRMGMPRSLYQHIERRLHARDYAEIAEASRRVIDLRSDAASLRSPSLSHNGHGGAISDRVQNGVVRVIEAEEQLGRAIRWQIVYARLDEAFFGTPEGEVAQMLYRDKIKSQQIALLRGCDRQTVRRLRDTYVTHAALLAAEEGLIRMRQFSREAQE